MTYTEYKYGPSDCQKWLLFSFGGPTSGEYVTTEDCKIVILSMLKNPSGITKIVSLIKISAYHHNYTRKYYVWLYARWVLTHWANSFTNCYYSNLFKGHSQFITIARSIEQYQLCSRLARRKKFCLRSIFNIVNFNENILLNIV